MLCSIGPKHFSKTKASSQIRSVCRYISFIDCGLLNCAGVPFPRNFRDIVKTIFRRLFRVYAHIYSNHFDHICALGIEGRFPTPTIFANWPDNSPSEHKLSPLFPFRKRSEFTIHHTHFVSSIIDYSKVWSCWQERTGSFGRIEWSNPCRKQVVIIIASQPLVSLHDIWPTVLSLLLFNKQVHLYRYSLFFTWD